MEHPFGDLDLKVGFISGVLCGMIKMLDVYLLTDVYMIVLIKVFITAVVGGLGGVAGKHLFSYLKKKWEIRFNKNKKQ
jgi:ABC-type xylose transport system permease subunit